MLRNTINTYNQELDKILIDWNKDFTVFNETKTKVYELINWTTEHECNLITGMDQEVVKQKIRNNNYI